MGINLTPAGTPYHDAKLNIDIVLDEICSVAVELIASGDYLNYVD